MAGLVLAESYLQQGDVDECEDSLLVIEESDPSSDFFVLGNIQRIRGLAALADGDPRTCRPSFQPQPDHI